MYTHPKIQIKNGSSFECSNVRMFAVWLFCIPCISLFPYFLTSSYAQQTNESTQPSTRIDSIKNLIERSAADTSRVNLMIDLSYELTRSNPEEAIHIAQEGYALAQKLNSTEGMATCEANIALAYYSKGDYKKAIEYNLSALSLKEKVGDKIAIAYSYNNIALVYDEMEDHEHALAYYKRAEEYLREAKDKKGLASVQNNIGEVYYSIEKNDSALYYYSLSLRIMLELNNKNAIGMIYTNFASIYFDEEKYDKAIEFDNKSLEIRKELGDTYSIASSFMNLGNDYAAVNDFQRSLEFYNKAIALGREMDARQVIENAYLGMSDTYSAMKDYRSAYTYHQKYSDLKDSLLNEESSKQIVEMQTKYETEKKEQQITLLNKDKALQRIILWSVIAGLLIVVILAGFIFRSLWVAQKQKKVIEEQKQLVDHQKQLVEEKQKEILDSIHYARRIQTALLPTEKYIERSLTRLINK